MEFSAAEKSRYARQIILPEVGLQGQARLKKARVLLIGLGGLGSPASLYLAAAGVGTLGLCDFDSVALSNLHRQVIHDTACVGQPKTRSAATRLQAVNPEVSLRLHPEGITPDNALELLADYDVIVDGSDNFGTRYLVNDAAVLAGKPLVYGSIFQFEGQVSRFDPRSGGPCYRCLFPEMPKPGEVPNCAEAGVMGALCGLVGSWQALEAMRAVLGIGESLAGRLLTIDARTMRVREVKVCRDSECPVCGESPEIQDLSPERYQFECAVETELEDMDLPLEISVQAAAQRQPDALLLDVREPCELDICKIAGAHHIPLGNLGMQWQALPKDQPIIVLCHHGMRSLHATQFLREKGLEQTQSMAGGIDAWSLEIDPSVPRY